MSVLDAEFSLRFDEVPVTMNDKSNVISIGVDTSIDVMTEQGILEARKDIIQRKGEESGAENCSLSSATGHATRHMWSKLREDAPVEKVTDGKVDDVGRKVAFNEAADDAVLVDFIECAFDVE